MPGSISTRFRAWQRFPLLMPELFYPLSLCLSSFPPAGHALATGPVWPIDVGQKVPQISFVGDPLNLASRLQHIAQTNGIAICRNTWILFQARQKNRFIRKKCAYRGETG